MHNQLTLLTGQQTKEMVRPMSPTLGSSQLSKQWGFFTGIMGLLKSEHGSVAVPHQKVEFDSLNSNSSGVLDS